MDKKVVVQFNVLFEIYNSALPDLEIPKTKFLSLLPNYLKKGAVKIEMINSLPEIVYEQHLLDIIFTMKNGYEAMSFYYLEKKYGKDNLFNMCKYSEIKQEAYYIWRVLVSLDSHPFIGRYMDSTLTHYIFQDKIESTILPGNCQFRFDLCFPSLNIMLEINEFYHEENECKINDNVKRVTSVLCGMALSCLNIKDVFGMTRAKFNKASDELIHDNLRESEYLKNFLTNFEIKVLSALLMDAVIRNDFLIYMFRLYLDEELIIAIDKYINCANSDDLPYYKELVDNLRKMIDIVKNSDNFFKIFNLKDKCVKSESGTAITFDEICVLLRFKKNSEITNLRTFLDRNTNMVLTADFDKTKLFSWENLYVIVMEYDLQKSDKDTLKTYLLYVGKTYEIAVKLMNAHSSSLVSTKEHLELYIEHYNVSNPNVLTSEIKNLKKRIVTLEEKDKKAVKFYNANKRYFPSKFFDKDFNLKPPTYEAPTSYNRDIINDMELKFVNLSLERERLENERLEAAIEEAAIEETKVQSPQDFKRTSKECNIKKITINKPIIEESSDSESD